MLPLIEWDSDCGPFGLSLPDQPLWALLGEPAMFEAENRGFILNDVAALTLSFMARVVDVRVALETRRFPTDAVGHFSLMVRDPIVAPAGGSFEVQLADSRARVDPKPGEAEAEAEVQSDVVTLSQILCGALTATQAQRYGRLAAPAATIELLDRAFPLGPPFIARPDWF